MNKTELLGWILLSPSIISILILIGYLIYLNPFNAIIFFIIISGAIGSILLGSIE